MAMTAPGKGHNSNSDSAASSSLSEAAYRREVKVVPGGSMRAASWFKPHPPYAARGEGCWVVDLDGRRILDCANNFFSLIHGHAFPPVLDAVREAMAKGTAFGMPTESEIQLAEALAARNPRMEQTRFCNSGTEAVLAALKGARALTGRERIAKFEGCYHGAYDWIEVSLDPTPANWNDENGNPASVRHNVGTPDSVLRETVVLPYDDPQRCAEILRREGPTLAAVILDLHASRAGTVAMSKEVSAVVQEACRRDGIMLISDEVICFRLSYEGASPLFGLEPDLITTAKIIGGGLPIGAVSGPAAHMAVFNHADGKPRVSMGGTFSGNPLSMAAGLASLEHYSRPVVERLNGLGDDFRKRVREGLAAKGVEATLSGLGSLFRLHLGPGEVTGYRTALPSPENAARIRRIQLAMLAKGVLLTPNCSGALSTPMTEAEITLLADKLVEVVAKETSDQASVAA
ncbi:aspartate aminotransferase family protein [Bosea sp. (in: a-proteobacteria)]|jgi:glutamate-1-semialdehyde 2,1-aminomutase|uniref:aspartate aminotransferase family protein n=1 Tax=Bosea sp. (in: a-proteobacteria) TaxID=1871050 RepID=UPI002DDD4FD7|nr:aminotransferase class III-fold pyridoxal phosphate-dependent enzyme [Bosea sp. (in: a-proteobacteria)]HEV2510276.1 aminotransferase class III-fold pyridoxal phosphate-dependent enzyme [Bosea sp. (in: a-proteobacteria)]